MKYLDIELMICKDIAEQLEKADRDYTFGYPEAALYRLGVVKNWCSNLILLIEEKLKEGKL